MKEFLVDHIVVIKGDHKQRIPHTATLTSKTINKHRTTLQEKYASKKVYLQYTERLI